MDQGGVDLKIIHLINGTGHGGDAAVALLLAAEQRKLGHDVQIIIEHSSHSQEFLTRAAKEGVPALESPLLECDLPQGGRQRAINMLRTLAAHRGDVLHFHTGGLLLRTVDVIAARFVPYRARVVTIHSGAKWTIYSDPERPKGQWRRASALIDRIICPGRAVEASQLTAGIPGRKVYQQPNPVPLQRISAGRRDRVREEMRLTDDDILVLFLGRLDYEKSPIDVISAFGLVAAQFPQTHLALAGSGTLEEECSALIARLGLQSRIHLLGYRSDTTDILKAADIYVQASLWESFGLSLIEAMAAGLPVITTRVGVIADIDHAEDNVLVVKIQDPDDMACALCELIESPGRRQALAARGRDFAQMFDASVIAQQYIKSYQELL
jgi:glycosyltransferase involved in cell wall biosynthesis